MILGNIIAKKDVSVAGRVRLLHHKLQIGINKRIRKRVNNKIRRTITKGFIFSYFGVFICMKKLLLLLTILLVSTNSFANCGATARSNTGAVRFGNFNYNAEFKISINNPTDVDQVYEVCREGHAQYRDHSQHFYAATCENYTIKAHEGLAKDLVTRVDTNFNRLKPHDRGVWLDAVIHIRGECSTDANEHKVVELQE